MSAPLQPHSKVSSMLSLSLLALTLTPSSNPYPSPRVQPHLSLRQGHGETAQGKKFSGEKYFAAYPFHWQPLCSPTPMAALGFVSLPAFTFTLTKNIYPGNAEKIHREKPFCVFSAKTLFLAAKQALPHELSHLGFGWRTSSNYSYGWERDKA